MSTLTLTLLILAFLVIGGVLLFNVWTARKSRGSSALAKSSSDVMHEPTASLAQSTSPNSKAPIATSAEPSLGVLTPYVSPESASGDQNIPTLKARDSLDLIDQSWSAQPSAPNINVAPEPADGVKPPIEPVEPTASNTLAELSVLKGLVPE